MLLRIPYEDFLAESNHTLLTKPLRHFIQGRPVPTRGSFHQAQKLTSFIKGMTLSRSPWCMSN